MAEVELAELIENADDWHGRNVTAPAAAAMIDRYRAAAATDTRDGAQLAVRAGRLRAGMRAPTPASIDDPTPAEGATIRRPVLRRRPRSFRQRPSEWAPWAPTLAEQLAELSPAVERVYLIGRRPKGTSAGVLEWAAGELPEGWTDGAGHYLAGQLPVLRYARTDGGRPVELHRATAWLGDEVEHQADTCAAAAAVFRELIERAFDGGAVLATPASTGTHLLQRSQPHGREWPVLDVETQELIRATSGQGRIELVAPAGEQLPELRKYDGRLSYAALCWGLPGGDVTHDRGDTFAGQARARYRVQVRVPARWAGVGLLPYRTDDGWSWPAEPRRRFTTWADGAELLIAQRCGWGLSIKERIVWAGYTHKGPLDAWATKLVKLREQIAHRIELGAVPTDVGALAGAMVRATLLHTIGTLHGRGSPVTRFTDDPQSVPSGAQGLRRVAGRYVWQEQRAGGAPELSHPEWSACVWARQRARLLDAPTGTAGARAGALHLPEGVRAVAFRTDAIYTDGATHWPDDGAVGRLRLQRTVAGPLPMPADHAGLLDVAGGMV